MLIKKLFAFQSTVPAPLKGISLALISTALFVLSGMLVRLLSATIDTFEILLFRQIVFIIVLLPAIKKNIEVLRKPKKIKLHTLRIFSAFVSLYFGFVTVSNLPFADAQALGFLQVLFVALISRTFLSERMTPSRVLTILIGFVGVMLIVQPELDNIASPFILTGAISALGAAIAVVCVRKVATTEPKITLLAYQALFVGFIALAPAIYNWKWPTWSELNLLILVGLLSSVGQWIGVTAYKFTEANIVANVQYVSILYSLVLGFFIFAEIPNDLAIIGAIVLLSSALIPLLYTHIKATATN